MRTNAKPVTVLKNSKEHHFPTRNEASMFLFKRIDKKALDKEMLTNRFNVFYTNTKDSREFEAKAALSK